MFRIHMKKIVWILGEAFHWIWRIVFRKCRIIFNMMFLIIVQIKLIKITMNINHFRIIKIIKNKYKIDFIHQIIKIKI